MQFLELRIRALPPETHADRSVVVGPDRDPLDEVARC